MQHIKDFSGFINESEGVNESIFFNDIFVRFTQFLGKLFAKKKDPKVSQPAKPPLPITGKHMLYLAHQQGPDGASRLVKAVKGEEKLDSFMRTKMLKNIPSTDPNVPKIKTGTDQEAALAFLTYQKNTWDKYKEEALKEINLPKNKSIKSAIDAIKSPQFSKDFLYTVAYIESRFDPNPKTNKAYKGLFQIGKMAWDQLKKLNPTTHKGSVPPIDPKKNAQAGHDYLVWSYDQFENKIKN